MDEEWAEAEAQQPDPQTWEEVADRLATAIRLTQQYVGYNVLPEREGWEWYDALKVYEAAKKDAEPNQ